MILISREHPLAKQNFITKRSNCCLSPKKQQLPKKHLYQIANELKIIIYNNHDLVFATEESKKVSDNCKLFLQPEWGKFDKIKGKVVDFIKTNPRWKLSMQTHKFLGID